MGDGPSDGGWWGNRRIRRILEEAEILHVAVATSGGPHVTPTVFDVDRGRLWFVIPRRSVKARVIARRRRVGALAQLGHRAVVMGGRARIVDPLTARGILSPGGLLDLPLAAVGYLDRNYRHTAGVVLGHGAPTLPLSRVLVSVDVRRLALLDGWAVVESWGPWDRGGALTPGPPPPGTSPELSAVPTRLRSLLADDARVVLGWQSVSGPLALPARWSAGGSEVETSSEAMILAGAASAGPACITAERVGYHLKAKEGLLLAGEGHARAGAGIQARVTLEPRRATWWSGEEGDMIEVSRPCP